MTMNRLVLGCAALLLATAAQAQVVRPSNTLYLALRGGATVYGGELDGTGVENQDDLAWLYKDFGWLAGAELGYQFTPALGFGLGFNYAAYSNLDEVDPNTGSAPNDSETLLQATGAFRYMPFPSARFSPYVNLGGIVTIPKDGTVDRPIGYGPLLGLGFDYALSSQLSLFLEGNMSWIFPDDAADGSNPTTQGDDHDYDNLGMYGGGLRYSFRGAYVPADIESIQCPSELYVGEAGSFMVMTRPDATQPVETTWMFGDGQQAMGMTASHAFSAPGTYTVTAETINRGGDDSESCVVTVNERPIPLALSGCRATPAQVDVNQSVTINATATGNDRVTVDFGDGTTATTLPATHSYSTPGSYTVRITAYNGTASESCSVTVNVGDAFCTRITELNPVYFGFGDAGLTADARARLDENIEILRRCPQICVTINGYTDDQETDQMRLSQRRADAVRDYYVSQGIATSRLRAVGRGQDPNANSKEDPGPGDSRARRADSIPSSCTGF